MKDKRLEERIQQSLNAELSGLRTTSCQRDQFFENAIGGYKVKRKISVVAILVAALMLITVTALAVALLSPKEIVEQVAVPLAQDNGQGNYTHDELKDLLTTLNENGITLNEGSRLMQAFNTGHGYWEREALREICLSVFGADEGAWSIEQRHWYGEMMVAIGAYGMNVSLIPEEGDMTIAEAHNYAAKSLNTAFNINLPEKSNEDWIIYEFFSLEFDIETNSYPPENAEWHFVYIDRNTEKMVYDVLFDRAGGNVITDKQDENNTNKKAANLIYPKEQDAIEKYGEVMYFWPQEIILDVYGDDYALSAQEEYDYARKLAENAIKEKFGADALTQLGEYHVGVLHKRFDDTAESGRIQLNWDFMFTTDPEFISDGYRVQFVQLLYSNGIEEIEELSVEPANMGNG